MSNQEPRPVPYPKMNPPAHRPKEMQVLALGLSRTATMSLYTAFNKLGYNSYHMMECAIDSANDSMILWHQAIEAKYHGKGTKFAGQDFDKMLWRYDAVTDIPCVLFVEELMDAYPNAKIILTHRPVEGWIKSVDASFYEILSWKRWSLLQAIDWRHTYHYIPILQSALSKWTGGNWRDKSGLPAGFAAHNEHVRQAAKARGKQVLEFQAKDGWEPLCRFLGKDIPEEPYPRINEGDSVAKLHYFVFYIRLLTVALGILRWTAPVGLAGLAWWWFRYYR